MQFAGRGASRPQVADADPHGPRGQFRTDIMQIEKGSNGTRFHRNAGRSSIWCRQGYRATALTIGMRQMPIECGVCRTEVDEAFESCPNCGAPKTKFRPTDNLAGGDDLGLSHERPMRTAIPVEDGKAKLYLPRWVYIVIIISIFSALAYHFKQSHLEGVRRKCIDTFSSTARCDCIINKISQNTVAMSYIPMLRTVTGLTQGKLMDIIKEAAMACIEYNR